MKKIWIVLLPLLLALLLTACGTEPEIPPPTEGDSFTETALLSEELYGVTLIGIEPDGLMGYTLELRLENRSQADCSFSLDGMAVNGLQVTAFMRVPVSAGLSVIQEVSIVEKLDTLGISTPTDLQLALRVSNADSTAALTQKVAHYYPLGESRAEVFVRETRESDTVLVDNEQLTVIVTGYREDRIFGYTAELYLVNKTDTDVIFQIGEAAVNGHAIDPYYATLVMAGAAFFDEVSWNTVDMEAAGITDVEELAFSLEAKAFPGDTVYLEKDVTLQP